MHNGWLGVKHQVTYLLAVILKGEQVHYDPFDEVLKKSFLLYFFGAFEDTTSPISHV